MRRIVRVELDRALQTLARVEPFGSGGQLIARFKLRDALALQGVPVILDLVER